MSAKNVQELNLCFHPAARRPGLSAGMLLFILAATAALFYMSDNYVIPILLVLLMGYSVVPFYIPTYYHLDSQGLAMKRWGRTRLHKWDDYRAYSVQGNGIVFWIEPQPSKTEGLTKQMRAIHSSVFFPMDEEMLKQIEPELRKKLVKSSD